MSDHLQALPAGHRLGEYRIEHVLGSGGFGITYYALDIHLNKPVAIKEYLPNEFALRTDATTVRPKSSADQDNYQWGLERFLDEARALARFDHPHLNKVYRFFEDNGTAYIVLEYVEGETLSQALKRDSRLDAPHLRRLLDELLSGLDEVHGAGYVHRDIKPGNIMLRTDGAAVLLDFGAARQAVGQRSKSITSILTPGYAPIEQYDQKAEDVGPWSDFYALGMVSYRCITGLGESEIPDAVARSRLAQREEQHKDLTPAVTAGRDHYDQSLLQAVDMCIRVDERQRPKSVAALREVLDGGAPEEAKDTAPPPAKAAPPSSARAPAPTPTPTKQKDLKEKSWFANPISIVLLLMLGTALVVGAVNYWPHPQERRHWQAVECNDESSVRGYLQAYPNGRYRSEAQGCLAAIAGRETEEKRKAEEAQRAAEAERKRKAEEAQRAAEAERKRKAEEAQRKAAAQQPGTKFRDCSGCPEMVVVPAGSFTMGSPTSEEGRSDDEGPQHRVTVDKFAVGRYEVTVSEFARFVSATGHSMGSSCWTYENDKWKDRTGRGWRNPVFSQGETDPVVCVSWGDAKEYVKWLSKRAGKRYRLLSESEWEYAARAGTTTPYHTGRTISSSQANYKRDHDKTVAVGSYPANKFGLHDMHGNVWEWLEDCWHDNYEGAPSNGGAWTTGGDCAVRVVRGGSWFIKPGGLRSAYHSWFDSAIRNYDVGFRVARVARTLTP